MSFPPVLNGFSHCGTHRDFDLACRVLPPWLRSFSRCAHRILCDSTTNLSPRCTGVSAETHVGAWSTRVRVPRRRASAGRSRWNNGLSTVYSVARTVGDPVCRTPRIRTTFDADSRWSFPPLSQPWHYVRSCPEEPLCWRPSRRDEALSSLYFGFR